jgi:DNA repair protein SbcC/Rad50
MVVHFRANEVVHFGVDIYTARLARDLDAGEPCPVCGSTSHPKKAIMESDTVDEKRLEREEKAYDMARETYNKEDAIIRDRKHVLEHETKPSLLNEAKTLGFHTIPTLDVLEEAIKEIELSYEKTLREIQKIQAAEQKQTDLRQEEEILRTREDRLISERDQRVKRLATLEGACKKTEEDLGNLYKTIDDQSLSADTLKTEQEEIVKKINTLELKVSKTEEQYRTVRQSLDEALKRQIEALKEAEQIKQKSAVLNEAFEERRRAFFPSDDAYHQALKTGDHVEQLKNDITDYQENVSALKAKISQLKEEIKSRKKEDPAPVESALSELENVRQRHRAKKEKRSSRLNTNTRLLHVIKRSYQAFERFENDYLMTNRMTSIARGLTGNKMTFERYILAHWLTEILTAANQKLDVMTNGRYMLKRKIEKAKGAAQQGLDLQVFDAYTTSSRDVSTLSGGESFKAALALALGLAEIVQRTSGGISLETMFIDEGFGSLDPESLDIAIETLMAINQTGRVVGVISHVSELKSRIETKIEVDVTNDGSHIRHENREDV